MKEEIVKFLLNNLNALPYLCIPIGLLYQAYRSVVRDNRNDRRENAKDTFVNQLSDHLREVQQRGDAALEDKARLVSDKETLLIENHAQHSLIATHEETITALRREIETLQARVRTLTEQSEIPMSAHKRGER